MFDTHNNAILNLSKEQQGRFIHLPVKQAIYVPSTSGVFEKLSHESLVKRVDEVSSFLAELFGGYSVYDLTGGYVTKKKGGDAIVKEHFVRVVSFATEKAFEQNQSKLFGQLGLLKLDFLGIRNQSAMNMRMTSTIFLRTNEFGI